MMTVEKDGKFILQPGVIICLMILGFLVGAGCNGPEAEGTPTVQAGETRSGPDLGEELPATNDISTAVPVVPTMAGTPVFPLGQDGFLPIDDILGEIDDDVCQSAYETKLELEALIAEGADVAELETAVEELIAELENCPTPTPTPGS